MLSCETSPDALPNAVVDSAWKLRGVTQRVGVWPANLLAAAYLLALNSRWVVRELRLFAAHAKLRPDIR